MEDDIFRIPPAYVSPYASPTYNTQSSYDNKSVFLRGENIYVEGNFVVNGVNFNEMIEQNNKLIQENMELRRKIDDLEMSPYPGIKFLQAQHNFCQTLDNLKDREEHPI